MPIVTTENILKVMTSFNLWWKTGLVNPSFAKKYRRFAFDEAMKRLNDTNIGRSVILSGARRVGKTTIL